MCDHNMILPILEYASLVFGGDKENGVAMNSPSV